MRNPFESLRLPGIHGQVATNSFKSRTIHSIGDCVLQIRTAELQPGIWDFGYLLIIGTERIANLPGEDSGWFKTEGDAQLYALGYIKTKRPDLPEDMVYAIDRTIDKLRNVPLFDFDD